MAYNFSDAGEGTYSFEARNLFYAVDDSTKVTPVHATVESHTARVSGKLAVSRPVIQSRATYNGCSSSQQSSLVSAASAAQSYAASALSYLQSHTSATTRYTTWFGTYSSDRHSTVLSHFSHLSSNNFAANTYDCTCTDAGTYAYVYPDEYVFYLSLQECAFIHTDTTVLVTFISAVRSGKPRTPVQIPGYVGQTGLL
jgi:peptidyl-Lys metalloendopeptidase